GLGLAGAELHGIIGYTVLARYRLTFDFTKDKMAWTALDFEPPAPVGLGEGAQMPEGLDMLGNMMKGLGQLLGRKPTPEVRLRGFPGRNWADKTGAARSRAGLAGSPAAAAGVRAGDRLTQVRGRSVRTTADVLKQAARVVRGDVVDVVV